LQKNKKRKNQKNIRYISRSLKHKIIVLKKSRRLAIIYLKKIKRRFRQLYKFKLRFSLKNYKLIYKNKQFIKLKHFFMKDLISKRHKNFNLAIKHISFNLTSKNIKKTFGVFTQITQKNLNKSSYSMSRY